MHLNHRSFLSQQTGLLGQRRKLSLHINCQLQIQESLLGEVSMSITPIRERRPTSFSICWYCNNPSKMDVWLTGTEPFCQCSLNQPPDLASAQSTYLAAMLGPRRALADTTMAICSQTLSCRVLQFYCHVMCLSTGFSSNASSHFTSRNFRFQTTNPVWVCVYVKDRACKTTTNNQLAFVLKEILH